MSPADSPAAWAGALLDDWRRQAGFTLQHAQRRAQRLQRNVSEQAEALLQALQQHLAHHACRQPTAAPAMGSITLAAGRSRGSFPGSGARFRRGLNVVADLAADAGSGIGMSAADAAPEASSDAQPEPERILISEACSLLCNLQKASVVCFGCSSFLEIFLALSFVCCGWLYLRGCISSTCTPSAALLRPC